MALASAMNMTGLDSAKPTSGFIAGRIYFATDTLKLYYDNGSALTAYTFGGSGALTLISDQTVTGSVAASIDFPSIAGTYRHLRVIGQGRGDAAATNTKVRLQINADTTSGDYVWETAEFFSGNTASGTENASDTALTVAGIPASTGAANASGSFTLDIPNYAGTVFHKSLVSVYAARQTGGVGGMIAGQSGGIWLSTTAITELKFLLSIGNFVIGSRLSLYGIS